MYFAVTVCDPRVIDLVMRPARPCTNGATPKNAPSTKNCTLPVGVPTPGATVDTDARNVTEVPSRDGLLFDVNATLVRANATGNVKVGDVAAAKVADPV